MSQTFFKLIQSGSTAELADAVQNDPSLARLRDSNGVSALTWSIYTGQALARDFILAELIHQHVDLDIFEAAATGNIAPGKVVFEVRNAGKLPVVFGILQLPTATFERPKLRFAPSLSGKRLLMTQTFRDFFRSEVISATEGIAVLDVTLVFTDLKGSTALYERIGDLNAYIQVQRHFQHLLDATVRHNGAVTKTIGDAVMAAFSTSADAVRAALEMREAVEQLNRDRPQRDFILKIGVHRGASIAVTLNERLDYFGQTVNIAARVQNLADGDEICITEEVYGAPEVAEIIAPYPVAKSEAELKGVSKTMPVYRLTRMAS